MTTFLALRKFFLVSTLIATGALALAACGGSTQPTVKQIDHAKPAESSVVNATAILKHSPSGTADLKWDPTTHVLTVKLALTGLAPKSVHPVDIAGGDCRSAGKKLYTLDNVVADEAGVVTVTSTVKNVVDGIPTNGWYVNVHNGPALSSDTQSLAIACGNVVSANPAVKVAQSAQSELTNAFSPNEASAGVVQLTLSGNILTVKLAMSGLEPNSNHMAHIHQGSCVSQGKVVYALNSLKADAMGNAVSTTTITGVKTVAPNWYVNVHMSTDVSTQQGNNPVVCGEVNIVH